MIYTIPILAYIFWSDLKHHKIPNSTLAVLTIAAIGVSVAQHALITHLIAGIIGLSLMLALYYLKPGWIGSGDIKLMGVAGLIAGIAWWWVFTLSWVIAAICVAFIQRSHPAKDGMFPFGTAICSATAILLIVTAI